MSSKLLTTNTDQERTNHYAVTHGVLSNHQLLPWENESEFEALMKSIQTEYQPVGQTEHHLVEELAGIIWRKKRLRQAESAYHEKELEQRSNYISGIKAALVTVKTSARITEFRGKAALKRTEADNTEELSEIAEYRDPAIKAQSMLNEGAGFNEAFSVLHGITREWWKEDALGQENRHGTYRYEPNADHLSHFLKFEVLEHYNQQYEEIRLRPLIKQQLEGEALIPNKQFEKFSRYEVHLDRKFERTLTVLVRMQEIRANREKNQSTT